MRLDDAGWEEKRKKVSGIVYLKDIPTWKEYYGTKLKLDPKDGEKESPGRIECNVLDGMDYYLYFRRTQLSMKC